MKEEVVEKIEKEIREKIKLPVNIRNDLRKEAFKNIMIAIIVVAFFTFLILGSIGTIKNVRTVDFNIFSLLILFLAIYLFEVSYRKENGKFAIFGIEALVTAVFTLFLPYIIFELNQEYRKYYLMISAYVAIYYIIKCIVIYLRGKKAYMRQASDIKEIVKKEKIKTKRSIEKEEMELNQIDKKEAKSKDTTGDTKKKRTVKQSEKKEVINIKVESEIKSKPAKKIQNNKKQDVASKKSETKIVAATKKTSTTKKQEQTDKIKEKVSTNAPKKRGRPKKEETLKKEEQNKTVSSEPKKRGRPRKVVTSND